MSTPTTTPCRVCAHLVAVEARTCPSCGVPFPADAGKRAAARRSVFLIIVAAAVLIPLAFWLVALLVNAGA